MKSLGPRSVVFPAPVLIVGTYDAAGRPNVMTAAWGGICCSVPPCISVALRKATYTYGNIVAGKCFTIGVPPARYVREADYIGLASGRDEDKFAVTGLTPARAEKVNAPYVAEFPFMLECVLRHTLELGLHTLFVGEILDVKVDESALTPEGKINLDVLQPLSCAPEVRGYFGPGPWVGEAFAIGKSLMRRK
jgi:flavin reductase (DIM6/NTAB) family NADH-FMN oxidoreductase RutF